MMRRPARNNKELLSLKRPNVSVQTSALKLKPCFKEMAVLEDYYCFLLIYSINIYCMCAMHQPGTESQIYTCYIIYLYNINIL